MFQTDVILYAASPAASLSDPALSDPTEDPSRTPRPGIPSLPPSEESLPSQESSGAASELTSSDQVAGAETVARLQRLMEQNLRKRDDLLQSIHITPLTCLNDVRRRFKSEANKSKRMVEAWLQKFFKPLNLASGSHLTEIGLQPLDWWDPRCHAVPGSRYIVKDGDWGTIIASTLGSGFFRRRSRHL